MTTRAECNRRNSHNRRERGQALIYGLVMLVAGLATTFFLFNAGKLIEEKTKLVNTADAVALSAGVMHARALNFFAYNNRAMIANTVAIAQLVSLASWIQYVDAVSTYGVNLGTGKFELFEPSYEAAQELGPTLKDELVDSDRLKDLAETSDKIIQMLTAAQKAAYVALIPARREVMNAVAAANYRDDGEVKIDEVPLTVTEFTSFVTEYSDDDRTRFAKVVETAANRDRFVKRRSWILPGSYADCASASPRVDWLDRRGGTQLIGFDEWRAVDTLAEKRWGPAHKADAFCLAVMEEPTGWGSQSAADDPSAFDADPRHYDFSIAVNPATASSAQLMSASSWGYSGLPSFFDLSSEQLDEADPRLRFAIRLRRAIDQTMTSEGRSRVKRTGASTIVQLNNYRAEPAGGDELVAVGASEVVFRRPPTSAKNGDRDEIGSLFNPYWHARLADTGPFAAAARLLQGIALP